MSFAVPLTPALPELPAAKQRLRALRESLATRRRTLSQAKLLPPAPLDFLITRETSQLSARAETISRARSGLVSELVEVFNIVEVGGRPPIGGKAGTKGEWTIGDLVLPVPGDIRRTRHFVFTSFFLLIGYRVPSRPYQRGHNTHPTFHWTSYILPRNSVAVRDNMDGREARRWSTLDTFNQGDRVR